ncbi:MAG: Ig-like domain-containing protein, partial [Myxococcota bacterium]
MRRRIRLFAVATVATVATGTLFTCTPSTTTKQTAKTPATARGPVKVTELGEDEPDGLRLKLRESEAQMAPLDRAPLAKAEKLSKADTARVIARLEPMEAGDEAKEFAFRERSLPAPRTGETIKETFPPPPEVAGPDASESGPLKVVRFAPEGKVPIAPQMSVTFSQPMVPVTSHAALAAKDIPVKIEPAVGGSWRWLGTKTLFFAADERLPMATSYSVEVPAGTTSATGGRLAAAKTWKFSTPPPQVKKKVPTYGPHRTDSIMWAGFDQRIDRQAVLSTIEVRAGKGEPVAIRLATDDEVKADKTLEVVLDHHQDDRWIAFKSVAPLPADALITVKIGPGTPSREGPRQTQKPQSWTFRTYSPLKIVRHRCGWSHDECRPQLPFHIEFNNPLDAEAFDETLVSVDPPIDGMRAHVSWGVLAVLGRTKARTKYRVTVSPELRDQFGQTLGSAETRSFKVGPARPQLNAAREGFVVLDPAALGRYSVFSVNFTKLKVQLYAVRPEDWPAFAQRMQKHNWRGGAIELPGKRVLSKTIRIEAMPDELVETSIDLSPALSEGYGQVIVTIEHLDPPPPHRRRRVIRSWIQVTDIGLDAFVDDKDLTAWTTRLADGTPLAGTELSFVRGKSTAKSDAGGLAILALEGVKKPKREVLVARRGDDVAILPEAVDWWSSGGLWVKREQRDHLRWYVFDDRGMYKPKETAHFKGWIRRVGMGEGGDVVALGGVTSRVTYKVRDVRGNVVGKGGVDLNPIGGFDFEVKFPDAVNLGPASLELTALGTKLPGKVHYHSFQIQEFRRPEYDVSVVAGDGPHFVGEHAEV